MGNTSLHHQGHPLAAASAQLEILERGQAGFPTFAEKLAAADLGVLTAEQTEILQVNVGKMCNMTCAHCHVDAGPDRKEIMDLPTIDACLKILAENPHISTLDLTGGAPEMNPHFRHFVTSARNMQRHVIDRCNLSILLAPGYTDMAEFLAQHDVEIVASLPCYLEENTDAQRGNGAFQKSIAALQLLNSLGYGKNDPQRRLTLVYNPVGQTLPPNQAELQAAYRKELSQRYGVEFDRLFTITNMPISRYLDYLIHTGEYESYLQKLIDAFNPAAVEGLMCRNTLSVGWDGTIYDCDFNQMLELRLTGGDGEAITVHELATEQLTGRKILVGQHCFGCTAGAGSGCQGAIA